MKNLFFFRLAGGVVGTLIISAICQQAAAQCTFGTINCTSSVGGSTSLNFDALTWTYSSGPVCPTGGSTSYTGNLRTNLANNSTLTVAADFTITGNYRIVTSGTNSVFVIPAGVTLHVTGNLGDCSNNNMDFVVNGTLIVDGFISGRNNNSFSGSGSITAGGLDFNNNTVCPAPCNIVWDVGTCSAAGAAGTTFCTLPISLTGFTAEVKANGVHVRWATESETHVDFLTLQKSSNGTQFNNLADFPSQGNTVQQRTYGFLDEHPLTGRSYYRLRETDLDGSVVYHPIVAVEYAGGRMLDLYPVPVTGGQLNLRTNYFSGLDVKVVISDVLGTVLQESLLRSGEELKVPANFKPGVYVLTYTTGDFRTTRRFVVH